MIIHRCTTLFQQEFVLKTNDSQLFINNLSNVCSRCSNYFVYPLYIYIYRVSGTTRINLYVQVEDV